MSDRWQYVASQSTIELLQGCKPAERRRFLRLVEALPYIRPDAISTDKTGRPVSLIWRDGFAIVYWLDHFVNEVRLIEIWRA